MKYLLMLTLLASAPLMASSFKEAQTELGTAQERRDACKKKVDNLNRRIDSAHRETEEMAGRAEYAEDMKARREAVRRSIDEEYNKALKELEEAHKHLQNVIQKVGRHFKLTEHNESYTISDNEKEDLEPVTKARPSYDRSTKNYRAEKAYQE
jgi:chromosome segregation ATPase